MKILLFLLLAFSCSWAVKLSNKSRVRSSDQSNARAKLFKKYSAMAVKDISASSYAFETNSMPLDTKLNPSVGNGHIATNVYRSSVFLNNLYNGKGGSNHRASIPSYHAGSFVMMKGNCSDVINRVYRLDLENGTFEETIYITGGLVKYRTYAHQFYNRILVTTVSIERLCDQSAAKSEKSSGIFGGDMWKDDGSKPCCDGEIRVSRVKKGMKSNKDLKMLDPQIYNDSDVCVRNYTCWLQTGTVAEAESPSFPLTTVSLLWTEMEDTFVLASGQTKMQRTFVYALDQESSAAVLHFNEVLDYIRRNAEDELLSNHTASFRSLWSKGNVDVEGDLELQKIVRGCLYYLYTSLPSESTFTPTNPFGGLSPGGLANGAEGRDYLGHVFWDMDTWMFPPLLLLRRKMGRLMVGYRMRRMTPAAERAATGGYRGVRYPWESAYTGYDVTPDACVPCRENEQHVTADVALAGRQYLSVTMDTEWLTTPQEGTNYTGLDYLVGLGDFWSSRPTYDAAKGKYDINDVMPPDEYRESVNNSIYTNVGAAYAIHSAALAACLANVTLPHIQQWLNVSRDLYFSYSASKRYHEEFEGYDSETGDAGRKSVKQADAVMLGFPWQWQMPDDVRANDLSWYEQVTNPNGPAMTWSMFSIGWIDLGHAELGHRLFEKGYKAYVSEPFKVWTEVRTGTGAVNFITGMGGFLQNLLFGYAGVRIFEDRLDFRAPSLPPRVSKMAARHLDYLGASFDYGYNATHSFFQVVETAQDYRLTLMTDSKEEFDFVQGFNHVFRLQNMTLFSKEIQRLNCNLQPPIINVNYDA